MEKSCPNFSIQFHQIYIYKDQYFSSIRAPRVILGHPISESKSLNRKLHLQYIKIIKNEILSFPTADCIGTGHIEGYKKVHKRFHKYVTKLKVNFNPKDTLKIKLSSFSNLTHITINSGPFVTEETFLKTYKICLMSSLRLISVSPIPINYIILNYLRNHRDLKWIELYQNVNDIRQRDMDGLLKLINARRSQLLCSFIMTDIKPTCLESILPNETRSIQIQSASPSIQAFVQKNIYLEKLKSLRLIISRNEDIKIDLSNISNFKELENLSIQTNVRYSHLLTLPTFTMIKLPEKIKSLFLEIHIPHNADFSGLENSNLMTSLYSLQNFRQLNLRIEMSQSLFNSSGDAMKIVDFIEILLDKVGENLENLFLVVAGTQPYRKDRDVHTTAILKQIERLKQLERINLRLDYFPETKETFKWNQTQLFSNNTSNLLINLTFPRLEVLRIQEFIHSEKLEEMIQILMKIREWKSLKSLSFQFMMSNMLNIQVEELIEAVFSTPYYLNEIGVFGVSFSGYICKDPQTLIKSFKYRMALKKVNIEFKNCKIFRNLRGAYITQ